MILLSVDEVIPLHEKLIKATGCINGLEDTELNKGGAAALVNV